MAVEFELVDGYHVSVMAREVTEFSTPELSSKGAVVQMIDGVEWLAHTGPAAAPTGSVYLTLSRGRSSGVWSIGGAFWLPDLHADIGMDGSRVLVEQLDPSRFPQEQGDDVFDGRGGVTASSPHGGGGPAVRGARPTPSGSVSAMGFPGSGFPVNIAGPVVDVLVVTDTQDTDDSGDGVPQWRMEEVVTQTNWALAFSELPGRVRIAGLMRLGSYAYTTADALLSDMQNANHPVFGPALAVRETLAADLMAFVARDTMPITDRCGTARRVPDDLPVVSQAVYSDNADHAFTTFLRRACLGTGTGAHEMGHLLGANHPREAPGCEWDSPADGTNAPYRWNRGYVAGEIGDVMAYDKSDPPCKVTRRLQYSNPDVNFIGTGTPSGTWDPFDPEASNDNAQAIEVLMPWIENYRVATVDMFQTPVDVDLAGWPGSPWRFDVVARAASGPNTGAVLHKYTAGAPDSGPNGYHLGWSAWEALPGTIVGSPSAVARAANRLDVVGRGTDNGVYWWYWNGSVWAGPVSLGGAATSVPEVSARNAWQIDVVVRGAGNSPYMRSISWYPGNPGYSMSGWTALGGTIQGGPTISGSYVYGRGSDNALWEWSLPAGWVSRGGTLTSDPDASRLDLFGTQPRVVARSTPTSASHAWMWRPSWGWSDLGYLGRQMSTPTISSSGASYLLVARLGDRSLRGSLVAGVESAGPTLLTQNSLATLIRGLN